jgi:hypothetical protein
VNASAHKLDDDDVESREDYIVVEASVDDVPTPVHERPSITLSVIVVEEDEAEEEAAIDKVPEAMPNTAVVADISTIAAIKSEPGSTPSSRPGTPQELDVGFDGIVAMRPRKVCQGCFG